MQNISFLLKSLDKITHILISFYCAAVADFFTGGTEGNKQLFTFF